SIDTGMKWGTALLDPAFQPVVSSMIDSSNADSGAVPQIFEGRPFAYGNHESLKIVVLMSDGQNTRQHFVTDNYRTGNSNVWYNAQEDYYSLYLGQDEGDDDNDGDDYRLPSGRLAEDRPARHPLDAASPPAPSPQARAASRTASEKVGWAWRLGRCLRRRRAL
ncbi:MAG: hypothetical protein VX228_12600, partial [Pseudomonadota bacterium]|nr:hypothetical protein [Pseudomonadota bacterium]